MYMELARAVCIMGLWQVEIRNVQINQALDLILLEIHVLKVKQILKN